MIKDILAQVDLLLFAEVALVLFAGVFAAITVRTLRTDRKTIERQAALVLFDDIQGGE